jgi:predicted transposase YdaD
MMGTFISGNHLYGRFFAEIFLCLYRMAPVRPWRAVVIHPHRGLDHQSGQA